MNFTHLYSEKKAAQAAAFFLYKAEGSLPVLKLTKLLYLAERKSLQMFADPIIGDGPISMRYGPLLSSTYDNTNGNGGPDWNRWISARADNVVALQDRSMIRNTDDLLALSENDLKALSITWDEFGHYERFALCDYTHEHCPEWKDPGRSSYPIAYGRLLEALGYDADATHAIIMRLEHQANLNESFANASSHC